MVSLDFTFFAAHPAKKIDELVMEGIHQTVHVIQQPVIYSDFLGQWTLSGLSSTNRTTITYNLTISAKVECESYSVLGWSGSGIDGDGYPFIMNFDEEKGGSIFKDHKI